MLHIYTKVPSKMATIFVGFDAGARAEGEKFSMGMAHMLEHMMFKGTEKRGSLDIPAEISFLGGDTNAFTSGETVGYYISVPFDNLEQAMEIMSDMMFNSTFPEDEFIREKEVVLEEEASSTDNVMPFLMRNLSKKFFTGRIADPIIGTPETISSFSRKELVSFYNKFYSKRNMILSVASCLPKRTAKGLMNKYFGRSSGKFGSVSNFYTPVYVDTRTEHLHRPMLEHSYVCHAFPGMTCNSEDEVANDVMLEILGQGMDSRLFTEVREKNGLCYNIGAGSYNFRDQGMSFVFASTRPENVDKMNDLILKEISRIKKDGVSDYEIQKAINGHKSSTYRITESSMAMAKWKFSRTFFNQCDIEEYDNKINTITSDDVVEAANKYFDESKCLTLICSSEE